MQDFQNISDEENRWESVRAKSDTNYNPTASVTNEKFFENIAMGWSDLQLL